MIAPRSTWETASLEGFAPLADILHDISVILAVLLGFATVSNLACVSLALR